MAVGKRSSTDEPLTEHDIADRIGAAAMRLNKILTEFGGLGMEPEIRKSRYWPTGLLESLRDEITRWLDVIDTDTAKGTSNPPIREWPFVIRVSHEQVEVEGGTDGHGWRPAP